MTNRKLFAPSAIHIRLPEWLLAAIEDEATGRCCTVSQVVRGALQAQYADQRSMFEHDTPMSAQTERGENQ